MSRYEFSLRQEVLMEKGADILGDIFRYERAQGPMKRSHPISVLYDLVWTAKQNILLAQSEHDLAAIEGQFDLAHDLLSRLEVGNHA